MLEQENVRNSPNLHRTFSKLLDNEDDYLYNNYTKNTGADCFSVCIGGDVYESLV